MIINNVLFWIHLVALAAGGAAVFGIPAVGRMMGTAAPEARPVLAEVRQSLSTAGRGAFVVLIISGPLLFWLKWDWTAPSMTFFGIKMVLVLVLLGIIIYSGINGRAAMSGDAAAIRRAPQLGVAGMVTYVVLILSAVFAFNG